MICFKFVLALVGFSLLQHNLSAAIDSGTGPIEFQFYSEDFLEHEMEVTDPLARLISERLAESLFEAKDEAEFLDLARALRLHMNTEPDRWMRYLQLNTALKAEFERRLERAEYMRKVYSATGALIGTLVAIPAGYGLSQFTGRKLYWLLVPAVGAAGAGLGFMLANLRYSVPASYSPEIFLDDLEEIRREIENSEH